MISGQDIAANGIPLTWAERTIWLASAISANPAAYNAACIVSIEGHIDRRRLAAAIRQAVGALAAAKVTLDHGKLEWSAAERAPQAFDLDLSASSFEAGVSLLSHIFRTRPIRADAAPLIQTHMVKVRPDLNLLMIRHHHVLLDFYANAALLKDIAALYAGEPLGLPVSGRNEIVAAEQAYLGSDLYDEDAVYWRKRLAGMNPDALWSPLQRHGSGGRFDLVVSAEAFATFSASVRAVGASPFQALLLIVHAHLSGGRGGDIVFGVPFANRTADQAGTLASMSRIVPFRVTVSPDAPLNAALVDVRQTLKADLARARFPIWENAERVFAGAAPGALPKVALNYMRASGLKFDAATGAIANVLYGERNAETYIRCIEEADGRLSLSLDDANDRRAAGRLGRAMHDAIANWRCDEDTLIGALRAG